MGIWVRGSLVEGNSMTNIKAGVHRVCQPGLVGAPSRAVSRALLVDGR